MKRTTGRFDRRTVLQTIGGTVAVGGLSSVAAERQEDGEGPPYEVWAADQGTDTLYVYRTHQQGRAELTFRRHDVVDLAEYGIDTPHMLYFSSDQEYALVASTGAKERDPASTAVIHAPSRRVVEVLETGAGSHFASFAPGDEYIHVDVIADSEIVRIDADLETETFEIVDRLEIGPDVEGLTEEEGGPICHEYDDRGRSLHTLGPSYHDAGLAIVDHDTFEIVETFTGDELPTNCGTMPDPTGGEFYLTAGLPSDPDAGPDAEPADAEGVGEYYVLDTETDEFVAEGVSMEGVDAHGIWPTEADGRPELWLVNRETNDGVIVDAETNEVTERLEAFGPATGDEPETRDAPDILWSSPDEEYMFGTLRGPEPLSGDPHAATGVNPGFAVWDIDARERLGTIRPDEGNPASDFHAIAVRSPARGGREAGPQDS